MAELTIEQKRLAIEKGLSQFLPESVLQRALSYWEREYGHQPSFVLNRFLSEICSNDELRMQRKEMLRQVLYEISILEKQQHLKVKDKKVSTTQPSIQINENNNALFLVFYDFVMAVLKGVISRVCGRNTEKHEEASITCWIFLSSGCRAGVIKANFTATLC